MAKQLKWIAFAAVESWLCVKYNTKIDFKIISASERVQKNYLKIISATLNMLENIREQWAATSLWNNFELISAKRVSTRWNKIILDERRRVILFHV